MGMIIECLKELGNGGRGGGGGDPTDVDCCWENSETFFSKSPVSMTEGKIYIIFIYFPAYIHPHVASMPSIDILNT